MDTNKTRYFPLSLIVVGLLLAPPHLSPAARLPSAGVVNDVDGVAVVSNGPIALEVSLGQETVTAGENFVLTVRLTNVTENQLVFRGFAMESALPYVWLRVNDGRYMRGHRLHPGDLYVPPRGEWTTVLEAYGIIQYKVFVSDNALVVPVSRDLSIEQGGYTLSAFVCAVLRIVEGEDETAIAVKSNTITMDVDPPTQRELLALRVLTEFWKMPRSDKRPPMDRFRSFLRHYPEIPYARQVRYRFVRDMGFALDDYTRGTKDVDPVLMESIRVCLDDGLPWAEAVFSRPYVLFFMATGRCETLEHLAKLLATVPVYDRRFVGAQVNAGQIGLSVAKGKLLCKDPVFRHKLQASLLSCLDRALTRNDKLAQRIAPRILKDLEDLQEWRLLELAAKSALCADARNNDAQRALRLAQSKLKP